MANESKLKLYKKIIKLFWIFSIGGLFTVFLMFFGIAKFEIFGPLPSFEDVENPNIQLASEVISSDGTVLGTLFAQNRSISYYEELSPFLTQALVSTEDERFYNHSGIDAKSVSRAVLKLGKAGGGSTVTQQLSKMLFTGIRSKGISAIKQKLNEWVIAVKLERQYTKEEIIAMYFNKLDFVNNAVGIKSAARIYFSKEPNELNIQESALLVGMAKNPSLFNPKRFPEKSTDRRNVVLYQMMRNKHITKEEFDSLKVLPLELRLNEASHDSGIATYFREEVRKELKNIFATLKKPDGTDYDIYRDGLKVYTTINYQMQLYAEKAVKTHLSEELQPAFYEHWSKKNDKLKKYAPFYFEGMSEEKKAEMVEEIVLNGIRNTPRYKMALEKQEDLLEKYREFNRAYYEIIVLKDRKVRVENERISKQIELNAIRRDTSTSDEVLEKRERVEELLEVLNDSLEYYTDEILDREPNFESLKKSYMVVWKPFDEKMQKEFKKPVRMTIFTWKGERDTVMSPRDSVIHHKWFLRSGLLSLDPKTGYIKAWVGGIDYKYFKYDHVRATRQVGSTFKPFVYGTAIENGISPCDKILNQPVTIPRGMHGLEQAWTPKNSASSPLDGEPLSLKMALANSINSITAKIMKDFGPNAVIDLARRCGLSGAIEPVPSICLGTPDVSLFEMVGAYSVFANKGIYVQPTFILRIEDKNGNVIFTPRPVRREAMTEENAYKMLELLSGVADYGERVNGKSTFGTGVRLRSGRPYGGIPYDVKIAGKTGTTQMQSDGWFMGITPDLVTGVWTGCEDRSVHFLSLNLGMGTNTALPIWGYYMNYIYKDPKIKIAKGAFEKPESLLDVNFDCNKADEVRDFGKKPNKDF